MRFSALALLSSTALTSAFLFSRKPHENALIRRATNSTNIPAAIDIGPSQYWDGDDGPWSSFPLQVGTPAQDIRVQVATAATDIWTIQASGCPNGSSADCGTDRGFIFNNSLSLTWTPNSIFDVDLEVNLGMDTSGNAGFDTVTLGWQGSGGPTVAHSTIISLASYTYYLGVFGLNPRPTNFTTFVDPQPSFLEQLVTNNTIPGTSWGYTAGNQYRFDKVFGSLVLGGYDANRIGDNNISLTMGSDISRDLLVNLQSITTGSSTNLLPGGSIPIFIDSTVSNLWLPQSACTAFEDAFGIEWDSDYGLYIVNDSLHTSLQASNPSVTFTLGVDVTGGETVDIVLPYGAFDLTAQYPLVANTSYYFPLIPAANETQYTLGRTFLQEAYIIADYDRSNFTVAACAWNEALVSNASIKSILSPNNTALAAQNHGSSSGIGVGAIVGIVVGIVAVVAILGLILFFLRRRKNVEKRKRLAELEATEAKNSNSKHSDDNEGKPFISAPMGGELGGGEIHELTAPHKPSAVEMESPYKHDPSKHGYSEMEGGGEYFAPGAGKGGAHEVHGSTPIYEMAGSDVNEMHAPHQGGK